MTQQDRTYRNTFYEVLQSHFDKHSHSFRPTVNIRCDQKETPLGSINCAGDVVIDAIIPRDENKTPNYCEAIVTSIVGDELDQLEKDTKIRWMLEDEEKMMRDRQKQKDLEKEEETREKERIEQEIKDRWAKEDELLETQVKEAETEDEKKELRKQARIFRDLEIKQKAIDDKAAEMIKNDREAEEEKQFRQKVKDDIEKEKQKYEDLKSARITNIPGWLKIFFDTMQSPDFIADPVNTGLTDDNSHLQHSLDKTVKYEINTATQSMLELLKKMVNEKDKDKDKRIYHFLAWNLNAHRNMTRDTALTISAHIVTILDDLIDYVIANDLKTPDAYFQSKITALFKTGDKVYNYAHYTLILPALVNYIATHYNTDNGIEYGNDPKMHAMRYVGIVKKDSSLFPYEGMPFDEMKKWRKEKLELKINTPFTYAILDKDTPRFKIGAYNYPFTQDNINKEYKVPECPVGGGDIKKSKLGKIKINFTGERYKYEAIELDEVIARTPDNSFKDEYASRAYDEPKPKEGTRKMREDEFLHHDYYGSVDKDNIDTSKFPCTQTRVNCRMVQVVEGKVKRFFVSWFKKVDKEVCDPDDTQWHDRYSKHKLRVNPATTEQNKDYKGDSDSATERQCGEGNTSAWQPTKNEITVTNNKQQLITEYTKVAPLWDSRYDTGEYALKGLMNSETISNYKFGRPMKEYNDIISKDEVELANDWQEIEPGGIPDIPLKQITHEFVGEFSMKPVIAGPKVSERDAGRYKYVDPYLSNKNVAPSVYENVIKYAPLIWTYHTLYDVNYFNENVFLDWVYLVTKTSALRLLLKELRDFIIATPELILLHKINKQFGEYARSLGNTTGFVDVPLGAPFIYIPSSNTLEKRGYRADYAVDNTIDPDNSKLSIGAKHNSIINSLHPDTNAKTDVYAYDVNNYLDNVYTMLHRLCKIEKTTIDPEDAITMAIPWRGCQLYEATGKTKDIANDQKIIVGTAAAEKVTINAAATTSPVQVEFFQQNVNMNTNMNINRSINENRLKETHNDRYDQFNQYLMNKHRIRENFLKESLEILDEVPKSVEEQAAEIAAAAKKKADEMKAQMKKEEEEAKAKAEQMMKDAAEKTAEAQAKADKEANRLNNVNMDKTSVKEIDDQQRRELNNVSSGTSKLESKYSKTSVLTKEGKFVIPQIVVRIGKELSEGLSSLLSTAYDHVSNNMFLHVPIINIIHNSELSRVEIHINTLSQGDENAAHIYVSKVGCTSGSYLTSASKKTNTKTQTPLCFLTINYDGNETNRVPLVLRCRLDRKDQKVKRVQLPQIKGTGTY